MKIQVQYFSYYKDLTKSSGTDLDLPEGSTLGECLDRVYVIHPELKEFRKSTLTAVGVEYQKQNYLLQDGDTVSLFPPVQGG